MRPLPSGRYQASYLPPSGIRINAPETLLTRQDADGWLARQRTALESGRWHDPGAGRELFGQYAERWIAERELKPRTRAHYRRILDRFLLPKFGAVELRAITPRQVRSWHAALDPQTPTMNTHAYSLLRGIFTTAVADDAVPANPCRVRGAGQTKRKIDPRPATLTELEVITAEMPERLQLMVLLAAWCALRFGELTELRRSDVLLGDGRIMVTRGVVLVDGAHVVDTPKSQAGVRTVSIPPHLLPAVADHLAEFVGARADALLFPGVLGGHLAPASLYDAFYPARDAAGRPDLRFHDLRHTGAVLAAQTGATLAELMARLGHSTPAAALIYQHASQDRDSAIATALSQFAAAHAERQ